jgi:hypothetical protein
MASIKNRKLYKKMRASLRRPTSNEREAVIAAWSNYFQEEKKEKVLAPLISITMIGVWFAISIAVVQSIGFNGLGILILILCGGISLSAAIGSIVSWSNSIKAYQNICLGRFKVCQAFGTDFRIEQIDDGSSYLQDQALIDVANDDGVILIEEVQIPLDWANNFIKNRTSHKFPILVVSVDEYKKLIAINEH